MLGICNLSVAQTENEGNEIDISFSEVSETQIVGESSQLGIKLSAVRENDNDVVSIQLSDNKTVVLSRNVGNLNFYVSSKQFDTATSFIAEGKESTTIDVLAEYLWQYRGYNALGDTLLNALLVLSNWPQGVAFEEPELSTDEPDRVFYPLTVIISPDSTTGNVSSPTKFIDCGNGGKICKQNYVGTIGLIATPAAGYVFKQWSGACTGTITSCTVNMSLTGARSVTATFIKGHSLTVTTAPANSGTVSSSPMGINCGTVCNYDFPENSDVTLTATPINGSYTFNGWSGACTDTSPTCTMNMTVAKTVTANFVAQSYPLSVIIQPNATAGKVTNFPISYPLVIDCGYNNAICSANVSGKLELAAVASATHIFIGWSSDSTCFSNPGVNEKVCNVDMTTSKTVKASFKPVTRYYILGGTESHSTYSSSSPLLPALSYNLNASLSGTKLTLTISRRDGLAFDTNYPYPATNPLEVSISGFVRYQYSIGLYAESSKGKTLISYTHDVSLGEFIDEYAVSINNHLFILGPVIISRE